jgi:hypothetical protein
MSNSIAKLATLLKVSTEEATIIEDVIDKEWLVDWSEDSNTHIRNMGKLAQEFIANGMSWE